MTDDAHNTCQRAFAILAARHDAHPVPGSRNIEIRRRIAQPGTLSDGTRAFVVTACSSWRWITVTLGWQTLGDIDHRAHWEDPKAMARAVIDVIDHHALTYRAELTPAGEQLVIPGCEKHLAPGARQLDLF